MLLNVEFTELESKLDIEFEAGFHELGSNLDLTFGEKIEIGNVSDYQCYTGDYEVTPRAIPQSLLTNGKLMLDDVEVKSIPYHEVSNTSDGVTVSIACEFHEPINPDNVALIIPKTITKNGTYNANNEGVDAYNPIVVDVKPDGVEGSLEITYDDGTIELHEFIEINKEK